MQYAIIAAGRGERLGAPAKPLVTVAGETLVGRLLRQMGRGVRPTVVTTPAVASWIAVHAPQARAIVFDSPSPVATLRRAVDSAMPGRLTVATTDAVCSDQAFAALIAAAEAAPDGVSLTGVTAFCDDERPLYVHTAPGMDVCAFAETPDARAYVSAGIYVLDVDAARRALAEPSLTRLRDFQRRLLATAPIRAVDMGRVHDIDRPADLDAANRYFTR